MQQRTMTEKKGFVNTNYISWSKLNIVGINEHKTAAAINGS